MILIILIRILDVAKKIIRSSGVINVTGNNIRIAKWI